MSQAPSIVLKVAAMMKMSTHFNVILQTSTINIILIRVATLQPGYLHKLIYGISINCHSFKNIQSDFEIFMKWRSALVSHCELNLTLYTKEIRYISKFRPALGI